MLEQSDELDALLALTDAQIQALPPDVGQQVREAKAAAEDAKQQAEQARQRRVAALGQRIVATYHLRKTQRETLEQRWLADVRRVNAQYSPDVLKKLQNRVYGSQQYVPLVRRIVNIVEARLIDLLFPTEERNFAVTASPVPSMAKAETLAAQMQPGATVPAGPDGQPVQATAVAMALRELREEAAGKAENMQREIDDQLRQANYPAQARRALHDAMVMGTGVLKGPTVLNRIKKVWEGGQLHRIEDLSPTVVHVPLWDFFPDLSARDISESESDIERHYMTRAQLAKLPQQPGFEAGTDAIREALKNEAHHTRDAIRDSIREAAGTQGVPDTRFMVLEYHGPIERQELLDIGADAPHDELLVYEGVVWVLETGAVIKALVNPLDTQERPYAVFCWEKDPGSVFGFGLSHELSDMDEAANSAFRAAMDNMGLAVGGQVVINDKLIRPENGRWAIEPNKVWRASKQDTDVRGAFTFVQMDSRVSELIGVFDRSKALMDDIGGPAMAMQGQDSPNYLDTARGVSIAQNAANIWIRRAVRSFDDDVTSPLVGRFVDWNMQYSDKEDIKGDLLVQARGTTALLEAEGQMQKMGIFLQAAKDVPMPFAKRINQLRTLGQSMRVDTVDLLPDDAEAKAMGEKLDNQPPPVDPAVERIKLRQAEIADNAAQREHELLIENSRNNLRLAEIASREQTTMEEARQRYGIEALRSQNLLEDRREQRAHDAQSLNAELASRMATGAGV